MMKRTASIAGLLAALLVAAGIWACAEETQAELFCEGVISRETGINFSYHLPQLMVHSETDKAINESVRELAQTLSKEDETTAVRGSVSFLSPRYVSLELISLVQGGGGEHERLSAVTFARDGLYTGKQLNLSQILGLEQEEGGESVAKQMVFDLLWQMIETEMQNPDNDYPDGLSRTDLEQVFSPEEDFYLDENGNIVFFIQAGEIAGDIAGILRFPFSSAELLSEM